MCRRLWPLLLAAAACSRPEGGVKLSYSGGADAAPIVQKRLKALSLRSVHVLVEGDTLAVYVPGGRRLEDVKEALKKRGSLELTWVIETGAMPEGVVDPPASLEREPVKEGVSSYVKAPTKEAALAAAKGLWPTGRVALEKERDGFRSWLLEDKPVVTGANLKDATDEVDQVVTQPVVDLVFDDTGKEAFGKATAAGIGKRLAIVADDEVMSVPVVMSAIPNGRARLTLGQNAQLIDARTMAAALKSGALPRPLVLKSEETYAPREF